MWSPEAISIFINWSRSWTQDNDSIVLVAPGLDEILGLDTQAVGQPGVVVEEPDDLNGIVDGSIPQPLCPQCIQILGAHFRLLVGQLGGEGTECAVHLREGGRSPVPGNRMHQVIGFVGITQDLSDLFPEVVGVGLSSVVTPDLVRDHHRKHLSLNP